MDDDAIVTDAILASSSKGGGIGDTVADGDIQMDSSDTNWTGHEEYDPSVLVGCRYYQEWMDVTDARQEIYGTIAEVRREGGGGDGPAENDDHDDDRSGGSRRGCFFLYLVVYDDTPIGKGRTPPLPSELLTEDMAWGGCLNYYRNPHSIGSSSSSSSSLSSSGRGVGSGDGPAMARMDDGSSINGGHPDVVQDKREELVRLSRGLDFYTQWRVPRTKRRELVEVVTGGAPPPPSAASARTGVDGPNAAVATAAPTTVQLLPRVTMEYREFELTFQVKPSAVPSPTAGLGVFVTCRLAAPPPTTTTTPAGTDQAGGGAVAATGGCSPPPALRLEVGELLDIGVYAPLIPSDRREMAVFQCKSFLLDYRCNEYVHHSMGTTHTAQVSCHGFGT
jgi:hypothetical protein